MAYSYTKTNHFSAKTCSNSKYSGLLNKGEISVSQGISHSGRTIDLGNFYASQSEIQSVIPAVAQIDVVGINCQIKQSRSNTNLYFTKGSMQTKIGSTQKGSYSKGEIGNSWISLYYEVTNINATELRSSSLLGVGIQGYYKGSLSVTQSFRSVEFTIKWREILTDSISLNKTSMSLNKGGSETLTVSRSPSSVSYPTITWTSSNTGVATVDSNGKVTAVGNGSATITAKTTDGRNLSKTCTVTVTTPVTGVTVSPATLTLNVGGTYTLSKTISPSDASNKNVTWSTNNTGVATVDSSGKVTAVAKGTCTITCTSSADSTKKGTCAVTVNQQATGISISPTSVTLEVGQTTSVSASVSPSNANNRNYTLSSNNTAVATVSNEVITAIAPGTTTITATSSDGGHKANCTVTVKSANIFKIANGSIFIQNMILGSTNIKSAYIGGTQIFKK